MADPALPMRGSPLGGLLPWSLPEGSLALSEVAFAHQIVLRRRMRAAAYLGGLPVPLEPNRVEAMGPVRILWLGPDEWLVTAPEGAAPDLTERLARAVTGRHAALLGLSSSRTILSITGPRARGLLQKGCGIDLHPRAFGPGQCAQTLFAKLPVIIDQLTAAPAYRLFVRRSYARWLCEWLIDAAEEFRV